MARPRCRGAALVLLPPGGPLCAGGGPAGPDFGWFAYAPLNSVIDFGPLWGRWVAGALLAAQFLVAVIQLRRLRAPGSAAE